MIPLIQFDNLFEEWIAVGVRAGRSLSGEIAQLKMEFPHLLHDAGILDIERLYLIRQRVVVGTLATLPFLGFGFRRFAFLRGSLGLVKRELAYDAIDLLLHRFDLLVRQLLEAILEVTLQLELDEVSMTFEIALDVSIENLVVGELEQERSSDFKISLFSRSIQPLLQLQCELFVHDELN